MIQDKRVQIYDDLLGTISTIPSCVLASGMVRMTIQGIEGECWVRPDQLKKIPYLRPPCDEQIKFYLYAIKSRLDEVYPMSLEDWEDWFRRDQNAEREIVFLLHISAVYKRLTENKPLPSDVKQDVFHILRECVNHPRDQVIMATNLKALSRPVAEAVVAEFYRDNGG